MPKGIDPWHDVKDIDKKAIEDFADDMKIDVDITSDVTINNYIRDLKMFSRFLKESYNDLSLVEMKDVDIVNHLFKWSNEKIKCIDKRTRLLIEGKIDPELNDNDEVIVFKVIERLRYSTDSQEGFKRALSRFYRWYYKLPKKQSPPFLRLMKFRTKKQKRREFDPVLDKLKEITDEEYQKMIEACDKLPCEQLESKAFLEVFRYFGTRDGELCSNNLGEGECGRDELGTYITIHESKTQKRQLYVDEYDFSYFHEWLETHPLRGQSNAPVWVSLHNRKKYLKRLEPADLQYRIIKIQELTDISREERQLTPYHFRHRCMNYRILERGESPMQMTYFFGTSIQTINENYLHNKQDKYRKWLKERKLQNGELKPTYNEIQQEKHRLETEYEERFKQMEQRFDEKMKIMDSGIARATRRKVPGYPSEKIIEDYQRLKKGLEMMINRMTVEGRSQAEIEEFRKMITAGLA